MKLKKFFAGVLAAAMMLTVGATAAFADVGTTTPVANDGMVLLPLPKSIALKMLIPSHLLRLSS